MCEGLRPSLGAGAENLLAHYGMKVPGVHVAKSFTEATAPPMTITTGPVEAWKGYHPKAVAGGTVIATDGTSPLRAILRYVAKPHKHH
jgi:hypothetical protein